MEEPQEIGYDGLGCFLLDPMASAVDQDKVLRGHGALAEDVAHELCSPRELVHAPVLLTSDEHGRDRHGRRWGRGRGEGRELGERDGVGEGAVPVEAALEACAGVLGHEDVELGIGEPCGRCWRGVCGGGGGDLGHGGVEGHDVVLREGREGGEGQCGERVRGSVGRGLLCCSWCGGFEGEVGAEEGAEPAWGIGHVGGGGGGGEVLGVVFARGVEGCEAG